MITAIIQARLSSKRLPKKLINLKCNCSINEDVNTTFILTTFLFKTDRKKITSTFSNASFG